MKLLREMKNYIYLSAWLFLVNPLHADASITVSMDNQPVVTNKMNGLNTLTINVSDDGIAPVYSTTVEVWIDYASSGIPVDDNTVTWAKMTIGGLDEQNIVSSAASFVISPTDVKNAIGFSSGTMTFDLQVKVICDACGGSDKTLDLGPDNAWGLAGTNSYLTFDNQKPRIHSKLVASNGPTNGFFGDDHTNTEYENGQDDDDDSYINGNASSSNNLILTFAVSQALYQSGTYRSFIKFTGNSGDDNGIVHYYYLSDGSSVKNSLNGEDITDDITTLSGVASPLVDGSRYDITFHLYDETGNFNDAETGKDGIGDYYRTDYKNVTYDLTKPTISEITTNEGTDPKYEKIDDNVHFNVVFSEAVMATQDVKVTFETNTDPRHFELITAWGDEATLSNYSTTKSHNFYTVVADDFNDDLYLGPKNYY